MFGARKARSKLASRKNFGPEVHRETEYPTRLSFYTVPPLAEITVEEFQTWAIDRLFVLAELEAALYRNKTQAELAQLVRTLTDKYLPLSSNAARNARGSQLDAERRKDHYSHFILRLAFCRSEDLRARFVRTETTLFRQRFQQEDPAERQLFLQNLDLDWEVVSDAEKASLAESLASASGQTTASSADVSYFKVPWTKVPDLVSQRRVFLKAGMAYVPSSEQLSLLSAEFSKRLMAALELTARALPRLDEDDRIVPILNHLSRGFVAPEYVSSGDGNGNGERVTAAQVPSLVKHFPLCMRHLHDGLTHMHHLKHFGRLQYGTFLKGIGLDVEEALVFWRTNFTAVTDDKFNKEYRYNIRHTYGLEGNRKNYKPMSCQQILTGPNPGSGDCHGCPYKHFSQEALAASLDRMGVTDGKVQKEVHEAVKHKHFHVACTRVFEATHPSSGVSSSAGDGTGGADRRLQESISHPNMYFERSLALSGGPQTSAGKYSGASSQGQAATQSQSQSQQTVSA